MALYEKAKKGKIVFVAILPGNRLTSACLSAVLVQQDRLRTSETLLVLTVDREGTTLLN